MFLIIRFCSGALKVWNSFIIIRYDFQKHNGLGVLLERPKFIPQKFICLMERDETFSTEKNVKIKTLIWQLENVHVWGNG